MTERYGDNMAANTGVGTPVVKGEPFESWVDVASFVDADELRFSEVGLR